MRFHVLCLAFVLLSPEADAQITGWTAPVITTDVGVSTDSITIAEDATPTTTVYTFVATPTSPKTIASYELISTGMPFSLSSPGGVLTVNAALDYETTKSYVVIVKATDNTTTPNVGTATVTITVTDVNEATPTFGQTSYTVCTADGATAETVVTTFAATDANTDNTITYTITSEDANSDFKVLAAELQVNTAKTLDMATTPTYTLIIEAVDNGSPAKTGSATYTINVEAACSGATTLAVTFFTLLMALVVSLN